MMLSKFARVMLLLLIVFVSSIILPKYYWKIFQKNIPHPFVFYSSVLKDFVYYKPVNKKIKRFDNRGSLITRKKFEELTPLFNYRALIYRDEMPDTINNWAVDLKELKSNSFFINIKPDGIFDPLVPLFPLLESKPDGPKLSMPDDFCRTNNRFEFIVCETNEIDEKLSASFTEALTNEGFVFPGDQYYGNPTTRKSFDEGYFIVDANGKLFHVKRVKNKPYVKKVELPEGAEVAYMRIMEMNLREFFGVMITQSSEVYILKMDDYKWTKLPIKNYDYRSCQLRFQGNIFYRIINVSSDKNMEVFVTDRNYKLLDTFTDSWKDRYEASSGNTFKYLFPFSLNLADSNSSYVDFYFHFNGLTAIPGILLSLILAFFLHRHREEKHSKNLFAYVLVLLTGVYGLIAVALIRNEYEQ